MNTRGYVAHAAKQDLVPYEFSRRELGAHDVALDISFSGICHSDIHQVLEDWGPSLFPMVPGHEIVGIVTQVGAEAKKFKVGERIGVGTYVDSCRTCEPCRADLQQYCAEGNTQTYNGVERDGTTPTLGGYSNNFVVNEDYAAHVAESLDFAGVAPLLCAGITLYSPLKHWGAGKGKKVGIIGLGGLGHLGLKFSHALGAETTVFSHSPGKKQDALRLGADHFVDTSESLKSDQTFGPYDLIISTVAADIALDPYLRLLNVDGTLVIVGLSGKPLVAQAWPFVGKRLSLAGSCVGGMKEIQEMLDFCAENNITSDVEVVDANYIKRAYERTVASDVKYRFVIDASTF
jgi:alcohol dehydrogenase (NADP+)